MIATMPVLDLQRLAGLAGFTLRMGDPGEDCPLYTWVVPDDGLPYGDVLYTGKAEGSGRVGEESHWRRLDPYGDAIHAGFVNFVVRNNARVIPWHLDRFDPAAVEPTLAGWDGEPERRLRERMAQGPWTIPDVETVLIRITVRAGVVTANASGAGLWNGWCGDPRDTLAVIATDRARQA